MVTKINKINNVHGVQMWPLKSLHHRSCIFDIYLFICFENCSGRAETCKQSNETIFAFKLLISHLFAINNSLLFQGVNMLYIYNKSSNF